MKFPAQGKRYQARGIDILLLGSLLSLNVGWWFLAVDWYPELVHDERLLALNAALALALLFFYLIVPLKLRGQTFGMKVMGQKLIRIDGKPLGWGILVLRFFGGAISFDVFGIGYFSAFWHEKKQTWHDRWTGTVVIQDEA